VDFRAPDSHDLGGGHWDLVLANLTGAMLRSSGARIRTLLAPGGLLVASGFDESEREAVQDALQLTERAAIVEDGWVGLVLGA
jgi:ribosomal protein L11 methylase PrmA